MSITYSDGNVYLECDECGNDVKVRLEGISDSVYCSTCNRYLAVPVHRVLAKYKANSEERNQNRFDKEQRKHEHIEDKKFARRYEKEVVSTLDLGSLFVKVAGISTVFLLFCVIIVSFIEKRNARIESEERAFAIAKFEDMKLEREREEADKARMWQSIRDDIRESNNRRNADEKRERDLKQDLKAIREGYYRP